VVELNLYSFAVERQLAKDNARKQGGDLTKHTAIEVNVTYSLDGYIMEMTINNYVNQVNFNTKLVVAAACPLPDSSLQVPTIKSYANTNTTIVPRKYDDLREYPTTLPQCPSTSQLWRHSTIAPPPHSKS
jgi:hypothetical protein